MLQISNVFGTIAGELDACARIFSEELDSDRPFVRDLCKHIENYRGKQVRPALVLLSGRACGRTGRQHQVLGAVVEMVHIATLVHDDVLDEADVRRQAATVSKRWGVEAAVLLGDYLFSHAFRLCSTLDSQYASLLIGQTAVSLCSGELMQVGHSGASELTEAEYFEIIDGKTASLIGACCQLGAKYADADEQTVIRMRDFGVSLGKAFQIIDDLLDVIGDEDEVGKSLGRDLDKGKLTLPLIHYMRSCDAGSRDDALALLRGDGPDRHRVLSRMLTEAGSLDYAEATAQQLVRDAVDMLADLPPSDARDSLTAMAEFTVARRR